MSMILKATAGLLCIYGAVVMAAWLGQRRLMYVPNPERYPPSGAGLAGATEEPLETPDGARLVVWSAAARPGKPTILYFHGNAGGLLDRAGRFARYQACGFGVVMMAYRGYGGSTGSPSERNNLGDARLLYDKLVRQGIRPADIVLYGESLGSGVAVQLAASVPVGGVVLDAPYTSIVEIAARAYPYLPVRPLLADRYESARFIDKISAPLLVLHGARDHIIPVAMGEELHRLAREPKKIAIFPDGLHTDLDDHGAVDVVSNWIDGLGAGAVSQRQ